jgi:hypothetical protein
MKEDLRFRKLLSLILDWDADCCYYDNEKDEAVIEGTEEDIYNAVMRDDEIHLLGSEKIKATIHMYYTDYETFSCVCRAFKAF